MYKTPAILLTALLACMPHDPIVDDDETTTTGLEETTTTTTTGGTTTTTTTATTSTTSTTSTTIEDTTESSSDVTTTDDTTSGGETTTGAPGPFCGDGNVDPGEDCDDGNDASTDSCISCVAATCGDGYIWEGIEECDDDGETCTACRLDRLAFVSSRSFTGDFLAQGEMMGPMGLTGAALADFRCQHLAENVGLPGIFMAWVSTPTLNAQEHIGLVGFEGSFWTLDGQLIAVGWNDFVDETLTTPIRITEEGKEVAKSVWTGATASGGATSYTCDGWTAKDLTGTVGQSFVADGTWSNFGAFPCSTYAGVYCIQVTP